MDTAKFSRMDCSSSLWKTFYSTKNYNWFSS